MADRARHALGIRVNRGLAWPLLFDDRGTLALSVGIANVEQSMTAILATSPGQRVMRPDFGCRLWAHLAEQPDVDAIIEAVREALARWEPRVDVEDVVVAVDDDGLGAVDVDVAFVELATTGRSVARFRCLRPDGATRERVGGRDLDTGRIVLTTGAP